MANIVNPGSVCSPAGATGETKIGTAMVCRLPATGGKHARWGAQDPNRRRTNRRRGAARHHQGLERRYIQQHAPTLADPAALLPDQLVDQLDDKQVGALRKALGMFWNGRKARKTDLEKLDQAGLLQDGQVTTRGMAAIRRYHELDDSPGSRPLNTFEQAALGRYRPARPRTPGQPAPPEDRSADADTDWSRYDFCDTCGAGPGESCYDLQVAGSKNATAHAGRTTSVSVPDGPSAADGWNVHNGRYVTTITDRHGREWTHWKGDLYRHDGCLAFPADTIRTLSLPSPTLADNRNYAGLCSICRSEWPVSAEPDDIAQMRSSDAAADRKLATALDQAAEDGDLTTHEPGQACGNGLWHTGPCRPKDPPYNFAQTIAGTDEPAEDRAGGADRQVAADVEAAYRRIAADPTSRANLEREVGPIAGQGYVPVAAIRRELGDRYPREQVDRVLDQMIEQPNVQLQESLLGDLPEHVQSGAVTIGGQPRHMMKIGEDRSTDADTDWSRYGTCGTCYAPAGTACWDLRYAGGAKNATAHEGRPTSTSDVPTDPRSQVLAAYGRLTARPGSAVRLADLRAELPNVDPYDLNAVLRNLNDDRVIQLEPDPDRRGLTDEDRAGAINVGGSPTHLLVARIRDDAYVAPITTAAAEDRSEQADTDWSQYDRCGTCRATAGKACYDLRTGGDSLNATPHDGRPAAASTDDWASIRRQDAADAGLAVFDRDGNFVAPTDHIDASSAGYGPGHEVLKRCPNHPNTSAVDCVICDRAAPTAAPASNLDDRIRRAVEQIPDWAQRDIEQRAGGNSRRAEQLTAQFQREQAAVDQGLRGMNAADLAALKSASGSNDELRAAIDQEQLRLNNTRQPRPDYAGPPVTGAPSTGPVSKNAWHEPVDSSPVNYHLDGRIGQIVENLGRDRNMDVDGLPLEEALSRVATDVVTGARTPQDATRAYGHIRDRLPAGSHARQAMDYALREIDPPRKPMPHVPDGTPPPLRRLLEDLNTIPMAHGEWRDSLHRVHELCQDAASGRVAGRRLEKSVEDVGNTQHESSGDVGKLYWDRAVKCAVGELTVWNKHEKRRRAQ